jgi:branched chain amino acid efflux pump
VSTWGTIAGLALTTFAIRALGPVFFGGRELPGFLAQVVPMLAPALVAALIAVDTLAGPGESLTIDARCAGLAAAAGALALRAPVLVVVFCAAGATALTRLIA